MSDGVGIVGGGRGGGGLVDVAVSTMKPFRPHSIPLHSWYCSSWWETSSFGGHRAFSRDEEGAGSKGTKNTAVFLCLHTGRSM